MVLMVWIDTVTKLSRQRELESITMFTGTNRYYMTWKFAYISHKKVLAPLIYGKGLGTYYRVRKVNI